MDEAKDENSERQVLIGLLKKRKEDLRTRLDKLKFTISGWLVSSLFGGLLGFAFYILVTIEKVNFLHSISTFIIGASMGVFAYGYWTFMFQTSLSNRLRRIEFDLIQEGAEELQENIDENFFTKLVKINFKYLDQYYLQTQEQASKSFRLAMFAAISGLLIVIAGIIMMFFSILEPAYVTTGAGVLSEFISAIFFYLYNRTILKMSQYHQKLVITQNISLALKITDDMDKELKAKSLEMLIDRLTKDVNKYLTDTK